MFLWHDIKNTSWCLEIESNSALSFIFSYQNTFSCIIYLDIIEILDQTRRRNISPKTFLLLEIVANESNSSFRDKRNWYQHNTLMHLLFHITKYLLLKMNTEIKNRSKHLENMISRSWISRFMQSQRASRLMLLTERKAAASSGVLPCWRPSVLSVFARQDNEPKQVINEKCINDWTLYVPKDKKRGGEERKTTKSSVWKQIRIIRSKLLPVSETRDQKKTQFTLKLPKPEAVR